MAQIAWRPMSANEFVGAFDSYTGGVLAAGTTVRACPRCRRVVTEATWTDLGRAGCFSCNHTPLTTFRIPEGGTVRPVPAAPVPVTTPVPPVQAAGPRPIPMMYRQLEYLAVEANLPAIVRDGLRAPGRATNIENADPRTTDAVPWFGPDRTEDLNGCHLFEYVHLFMNGRNTVMYTNLLNGRQLCVVRVRADVVRTPGTVLSDGKVTDRTTRFIDPFAAPGQVDMSIVRAHSWGVFEGTFGARTRTGNDERVKSAMQATLLVPDFVRAEMIEAIIAPSEASAARVRHLLRAQTPTQVSISVDANRFFTMPRVA